MNKAQARLKDLHGTPWQFRQACLKAWQDLMITTEEFSAAVTKYNAEWLAAASQSDGGSEHG